MRPQRRKGKHQQVANKEAFKKQAEVEVEMGKYLETGLTRLAGSGWMQPEATKT